MIRWYIKIVVCLDKSKFLKNLINFCKPSDNFFIRKGRLDEATALAANAGTWHTLFLIRGILALNLLALFLILFFLFSSLQMWLRKPVPWQPTQRNLLLWVIPHWTPTWWRDNSYSLTHTHTFTPPWLFLVMPLHTSACGRWSILALWHRGTC